MKRQKRKVSDYSAFELADETTTLYWPEEPYRGLAFFQPGDRLLFSGRENDVDTCRRLLADSPTRLLLLHGETGCGKSSFLRAGLIPTLERTGFGYHFIRKYSGDNDEIGIPYFIRCGPDPVGRIAEALYAYAEKRVPLRDTSGVERRAISALRLGAPTIQDFVARCRTPGVLLKSLHTLSTCLPGFTVLLVIDQAEEVLALADVNRDFRPEFFRFIQEFSVHNFPVKLLLALRKDYSGEFVELAQLGSSIPIASAPDARDPLVISDLKMFTLAPLDRSQVLTAIELPTSSKKMDRVCSAFEKYRFSFEAVATQIRDDLFAATSSVLPVMQIVCKDLYERATSNNADAPPTRKIDGDLYNTGGQITGPVDRHIAKSIQASLGIPANSSNLRLGESKGILRKAVDLIKGKSAQEAEEDRVRELLCKLIIEGADKSVRSNQLSLAQMRALARQVELSAPVDQMLDYLARDDVLLLRTFSILSAPDAADRKMFSLGHDFIGGVLQSWRQARQSTEKALKVARWAAVACFGALLFTALAVGLTILALTIGSERARLAVLENQATNKERESPLSAMTLAGHAMILATSLTHSAIAASSRDDKPLNVLENVRTGLPDVTIGVTSDSNRGVNEPLPKSNGFIFVTAGFAVIHRMTGDRSYDTQNFDLPTIPNATYFGTGVGESEAGDVLLLRTWLSQSTAGTSGIAKQVVILPRHGGVASAPFDIAYFRGFGHEANKTASPKGAEAADDLAFGLELYGDTVVLSHSPNLALIFGDRRVETFVFKSGAPLDSPFLRSREVDRSWLFRSGHAVRAEDPARDLHSIRSSPALTLLSYDLHADPSQKPLSIPLSTEPAFTSCRAGQLQQPCTWQLAEPLVQSEVLIYGTGTETNKQGDYPNLVRPAGLGDFDLVLLIDLKTGTKNVADLRSLRAACPSAAPLPLAASTTVFGVGTASSVLLGLVVGSSVDVVQVNGGTSAQAKRCTPTLFFTIPIFNWAVGNDGSVLLGAGPSGAAVWTLPREPVDTSRSHGESDEARDSRLMEDACAKGLRDHELPDNMWTYITGLDPPRGKLCDSGSPSVISGKH
jgi:hypothetical protein